MIDVNDKLINYQYQSGEHSRIYHFNKDIQLTSHYLIFKIRHPSQIQLALGLCIASVHVSMLEETSWSG